MSELKIGDKCKMSQHALRSLGLGDFVGQRWTVTALSEHGHPTLEMDNEDVELSMGPLPSHVYSAWTAEDEAHLATLPDPFSD